MKLKPVDHINAGISPMFNSLTPKSCNITEYTTKYRNQTDEQPNQNIWLGESGE